MSFDINWDQLVADGSINESIKGFLDAQFGSLELPAFISGLSVTDFSLGTKPPEITIRHIGDPFDEFYGGDAAEEGDPYAARSRGPGGGAGAAAGAGSAASNSGRPGGADADSDSDGSSSDESATSSANTTADVSVAPASPQPVVRTGSLPLLSGLHHYSMNNVGLLARAESPTAALLGQQSPYMSSNALLHLATKNAAEQREPRAAAAAAATAGGANDNSNDIQFIAELKYQSDLHLEINVSLLVNYPSPSFITLPIKLHVTDLDVHSVVAIAYVQRAVYVSFLCDIDDNADYFSTNHQAGGNFVEYVAGSQSERIDIIKRVRIESEIGEVASNVLRNVGKVEKFLVEQLRAILREEVAWPSWICLEME
ncbi:Mitochondrial distribution and morphology protein 12 [[Candida] zeylanoides]